MMALEGGSFGFQIGGQATDFVILVMNNRGADSLLHSKVKLGADASIAAGPKGREAEADTDVTMLAEMRSYSRAVCLRACRWKAARFAQTIMRTGAFTVETFPLRRSLRNRRSMHQNPRTR